MLVFFEVLTWTCYYQICRVPIFQNIALLLIHRRWMLTIIASHAMAHFSWLVFSQVRGMHPIRESPSSDSRKMSTDLDAPNDESAIQSVANEGLWKVSSSHYPERMSQRTQTRDRRLSRAQTLEIRMSSSDHTASEPVAKRRSRHSLKKSYDELPSQSQEGAGLPLANHKSSFFWCIAVWRSEIMS